MSSSDTKLDDLCEDLGGCKLDVEKKISDEELFKQPPPQYYGDCPICFLQLPSFNTGWKYQTCCGKTICSGCIHAPLFDNQGNKVNNKKCPFCRTPHPNSNEEAVKRLKKRMDLDDPIAIHNIGCYYRDGLYGFPQDHTKALDLFLRSGELGYAKVYNSIGYHYDIGIGVELDEEKAEHYYEIAAIRGDSQARHNVGCMEKDEGNVDRALKHWMIAVRSGHSNSLTRIKELYTNGDATKDDYAKALRVYQSYLSEIKSPQRDKAASADEDYRYY